MSQGKINMSDVTLRLELIAAKAKQLATDNERGKLWPGELIRGLGELAHPHRVGTELGD